MIRRSASAAYRRLPHIPPFDPALPRPPRPAASSARTHSSTTRDWARHGIPILASLTWIPIKLIHHRRQQCVKSFPLSPNINTCIFISNTHVLETYEGEIILHHLDVQSYAHDLNPDQGMCMLEIYAACQVDMFLFQAAVFDVDEDCDIFLWMVCSVGLGAHP